MQPAKPVRALAIEHRIIVLPMVLVGPCEFPGGIVAKKGHSALAPCCDDLVLAEGKRAGVSKRTDKLPVDPRPVSLRAVLKDENAMASGKLHEAWHIGRAAINMNDNDGFRTLSYQRAHCDGSDHLRIDINIRKDRLRADEIHARCGCNEAPRRDDHFIPRPDAMRAQNGFECQRSIGQGNGMGFFMHFGEGEFECADSMTGPLINVTGSQCLDGRSNLVGGVVRPPWRGDDTDRLTAIDCEGFSIR